MKNHRNPVLVQHPTIGRTAEIDQQATLIVETALSLSRGWILRKREPDIHIDYEIELQSASDAAEIRFWGDILGTRFELCCKGSVFRGRTGELYEVFSEDKLFSLRIKRPAKGETEISFTWNLGSWLGRCIDDLPHFDAIYDFVQAIVQNRPVTMEVKVGGVRRAEFLVDREMSAFFINKIQSWIEIVYAARKVAMALHICPILPISGGFSTHAVRNILVASALIQHNLYEVSDVSVHISKLCHGIKVDRDTFDQITKLGDGRGPRLIKFTESYATYNILGVLVGFGALETSVSNAIIEIKSLAAAELANDELIPVSFEIVSEKGATLTVRRKDGEPPSAPPKENRGQVRVDMNFA